MSVWNALIPLSHYSCSHSPDIVIVEDDNEDDYAPVIQGDKSTESAAVPAHDPLSPVSDSTSPLMSSAVQLNNQSTLTAEDPVSMMDSILNENGVISQNINLLGKWVAWSFGFAKY